MPNVEPDRAKIGDVKTHLLSLYQDRLSFQNDGIARITGNAPLGQRDELPSKGMSYDDALFAHTDQVSDKVCEFFEAALEKPIRFTKAKPNTSQDTVDTICEASGLYQQVPLVQAKDVRLLTVLPAPVGEIAIECVLRVASLESASFEALSYVWGTEGHPSPILVNGCAAFVKKNLYEALLDLRLENTPRILWIDSLCIDQSNALDKACQVDLMGEIFRFASKVVVYMGAETKHSRLMLDFLNTDPKYNADQGFETEDPKGIANAFWDISQAPWWRRYWVLQEYALPERDPFIQFGRQAMSATLFTRHYLHMFGHWALQILGSRSDAAESIESLLAREWANASTLLSRGQHHGFWRLYIGDGRLRHRGATEPKDRIYAIRELVGPVFKSVFPSDYTLPSTMLFTRATAWLLTMENFGDVWAYYHPLLSNDEPSWAIDFTSPFKFESLMPQDSKATFINVRASRHPYCEPILWHSVLTLDGLCFDEIHAIVEIDEEDILRLIGKLWIADIQSSSLQRSDRSDDRYGEAYSRLLLSSGATFGALVCHMLPDGISSYHELWAIFTSSRSQFHQQRHRYVRKMADIREEAGYTMTEDLIIDNILCDLESVRSTVNQWKQHQPSRAADFDQYLVLAVQFYLELVGKVPTGFETIADQRESGPFLTRSLEDAITWARELVYDIDTTEREITEHQKQNALTDIAHGVHSNSSNFIREPHEELSESTQQATRVLDENIRIKPLKKALRTLRDRLTKMFRTASNIPDRSNAEIATSNVELRTNVIRTLEVKKETQLQLLSIIDSNIRSMIKNDQLIRGLEDKLQHHVVSQSEQTIRDAVEAHLMHSTLFWTKLGFRGFGFGGTRGFQPGDKVCLLDGVPVPMVLRKLDDEHHAIVGAARVQGIMEGQALQLVDEGILEPITFRIK